MRYLISSKFDSRGTSFGHLKLFVSPSHSLLQLTRDSLTEASCHFFTAPFVNQPCPANSTIILTLRPTVLKFAFTFSKKAKLLQFLFQFSIRDAFLNTLQHGSISSTSHISQNRHRSTWDVQITPLHLRSPGFSPSRRRDHPASKRQIRQLPRLPSMWRSIHAFRHTAPLS